VRQAGHEILYLPGATITHLGGHSTKRRFPPIAFALDREVTRYRYFYKYYGERGARHARWISLVSLSLRRLGYYLIQLVKPTDDRRGHLELLRTLFKWNYRADPVRLVEKGEEPDLGIKLIGRVLER
jgi:GT2 family glycosyltransferase